MEKRETATPDQVRRLADFIQEEWEARKINEWLSSFEEEPTDAYTYVVRFERQYNLPHTKALYLFKRLHNIGVGFVIKGRHDHPTRFLWRVSITDLTKTLNSELQRRESDNENNSSMLVAKTHGSEAIEHVFVLRPGYPTKISLPADLTRGEADRLGNWIRTLSFE